MVSKEDGSQREEGVLYDDSLLLRQVRPNYNIASSACWGGCQTDDRRIKARYSVARPIRGLSKYCLVLRQRSWARSLDEGSRKSETTWTSRNCRERVEDV